MLSFVSDLLFRKSPPETEDIKGISNVTGRVRGNANGLVNFGDAGRAGVRTGQPPSAGIKEQAEAVKTLSEAVSKLDGDSNGSSGSSVAAGARKIRGLANVTGNVKGSGNGGVNFGQLGYE